MNDEIQPPPEEAAPTAEPAPVVEEPKAPDTRDTKDKIIDTLLALLRYHMPSYAEADRVAAEVAYWKEKNEPPPADWNPEPKPEEIPAEVPVPKTELQKAFDAANQAGQVPLEPAPPGPAAGEAGVPAETTSAPAEPTPQP
jgi:hypothetical protein